MRHVLAAAVLGTSLAFTATAALADSHDGMTFHPAAGQQTAVAQAEPMNPVVAGNPDQQVWNDRESGGTQR